MNNTCIVYGSSTGTCEDIAQRIAVRLGVDKNHVIDVNSLTPDIISASDNLIFGTSTWGEGEIQEDWYDGLKIIRGCDFTDKIVAIFGCGDSVSFSDTFCSGMAQLWKEIENKGVHMVGQVSTTGYTFDDSEAVVDGKFVGLALDNVNESDQTDKRIENWAEQIKQSFK